MSTPAATEQSSGPMTVGQAAEQFEDLFEPKKATKEVAEDAETNRVLEGDEVPEPEAEQEVEEEGESEEEDQKTGPIEVDDDQTYKVNGRELTGKELKSEGLRQADYTRKTMELAEERKAAKAEFEAVRSEREHYKTVLGTLQQQAQQGGPTQAQMDQLLKENPQEWNTQRILQLDRQANAQRFAAEAERVAGLQQEEAEKGLQARLAEESAKLITAIPEWKDEKKAATEKAELIKFAGTLGYSPEEVGQVTDSRAIVLLRQAYQLSQLLAKRAALRPDPVVAPKTARPGPPATSQISSLTKAHQRLAKTGKLSDAAAVFERFI